MTATGREIPNRKYFRTPATAPGPTGQQLLPHIGAITRNPVEYLMRTWQAYGDVVQFPVPKPPSYLINDPAAVRRVLVDNGRNYGKSTIQYRSLALVTGEGLLTADAESWRRQRPLVQPAFHRESLTALAAHIVPIAQRLFADWERRPGEIIDVDAAMMETALDVVGQSLFGTDFATDAKRLTAATLDALDVVIARARPSIPAPAWLPTRSNRKLHRALNELDGAVARVLADRDALGQPASDMVGMLLAARDDHGVGLTAAEVRDQLVTFIVAGHETVASALTWTWALLAAHPDIQRQMQAEADAVLAGGVATIDDYARLSFTRAVFDEALRLYPPAWLITRNSLAADELGGFDVPAGSLIILSPWLLHRHPAMWDEPDRFDPSRFTEGRFERTAFIPFGAGARQCIGKDFAYVESVLLLAMTAGRFTLEFPPGAGMPAAAPLVTVRPISGLPLRVTTRH